MKRIGIVAVLGVAATALYAMGCTAGALGVSNGGGGSCDENMIKGSTTHTCESYTAAQNVCADGICGAQTGCTDEGGTWGSSCPSGALGTCTISGVAITYYAVNGMPTAASAQMSCAGGTWTPG